MRYEDLLELMASQDRADLEARLIRMARHLGFDRMSSSLVTERNDMRPLIEIVENTPQAYLATSRDYQLAVRCPVLQHVKRSHLPIIYDESTYVHAGAADLWEEQAPFGYKAGISMALHLPQGRHLVLGVDRDQDVAKDARERLRLLSILQLAAACTVEPAIRYLSGGPVVTPGAPQLTAREREVLRWTAAGKSTWVIGRILALSEGTVNFHLRNAMRKLECRSRHVAACRAVALGLILP